MPGKDCSGLAKLAVFPSFVDKSSLCLGSKLGGPVLLLRVGHVRGRRAGRALGAAGPRLADVFRGLGSPAG